MQYAMFYENKPELAPAPIKTDFWHAESNKKDAVLIMGDYDRVGELIRKAREHAEKSETKFSGFRVLRNDKADGTGFAITGIIPL